MSDSNSNSKYLDPWSTYAKRKGVTTRTLDRWVEDRILRKPIYINRRKYLPSDTEPRHDGETDSAA